MAAIDRLESQPGNYNFPCTLNGFSQQDSTALANTLISRMAAKAQESYQRIYLWNVMSFNGFQNQAFPQMLYELGVYFQLLCKNQQQNVTIEGVVNKAIDDVIDWYLATAIMNSPQLMQYNQNNIAGINSIANEYGQFKQFLARGAQQNINTAPGFQQASFIRSNQPVNNGFTSAGSISGVNNAGITPLSTDSMIVPASTKEQAQVTTGGFTDIFGGAFGEAVAKPQNTAAPIAKPVIQKGEAMSDMLDSMGWMPTTDQAHKPAYRASTETISVNNSIAGVVKMNQADHVIPLNNGGAIIGTFGTELFPEVVQEAISVASSDHAEVPLEGEKYSTTIAEDAGKYVIELDEKSIHTDMMVHTAGIRWENEYEIDVYHREAATVTPLVARTPAELEHLNAFIKDASLCQTFAQVVKVMEKAKKSIPNHLMSIFDERLTNLINTSVHKMLSISRYTIDSFYADMTDLMAVLDSKYGDFITAPLIRHQPEIISKAFSVLKHVDTKQLTEDWFPRPENSPINFIVYLEDWSIYTFLNFGSEEIDVGFDPVTGGILTQEHNPALIKLADFAFKKYSDRETIRLMCLDGEFFTIRKSWITNDYLIYK